MGVARQLYNNQTRVGSIVTGVINISKANTWCTGGLPDFHVNFPGFSTTFCILVFNAG